MKALDLFAGAGGWDVAATALGWDVDGVELMPEARLTREAAGFRTPWADVRDIGEDAVGYDVHIGSPPCQTFSQAGTGSGRRALDAVLRGVAQFRTGHVSDPTFAELAELTGDERTGLVLEPLRLALSGKPTFIAWEQVVPVRPVWDACAVVLAEHGYSVATAILHAEQYGVPQTRRRAVLVARRDGRTAAMPAPTHSRYHSRSPERLDPGVLPWVSMASALGWGLTDKPSPTILGGGSDTGGAEPFGPRTRRELAAAVDGGRWVQRSNYSDGGKPGVTAAERGRSERELHEPSVTITSKGFQWAEPGSSAGTRVTVEEAAVLQTFPPGFPFQGNKGKRYQQVGNAVPPMMALAILQEFTRGRI